MIIKFFHRLGSKNCFKVRDVLRGRTDIVYYDIGSEKSFKQEMKYGITLLPTVIVTDDEHKEINRLYSKEEVEDFLEGLTKVDGYSSEEQNGKKTKRKGTYSKSIFMVQ